MGFILHEAGYAAIKANREVSIKEIAAIRPDLAILDYLLPFGSGIEMCLEIKNNPLTAHIPVILYSASNQLKQFAKSSKADAYIAKPFDVDELIELIRKTAL
jgi:two-component system phosphate regulon response regulator PhoB